MDQDCGPEGDTTSAPSALQNRAKNDYNLNISRYISAARAEVEIDLKTTHATLVSVERDIRSAATKHNLFLKELGLPALPLVGSDGE